jgi:hypothetical protein
MLFDTCRENHIPPTDRPLYAGHASSQVKTRLASLVRAQQEVPQQFPPDRQVAVGDAGPQP